MGSLCVSIVTDYLRFGYGCCGGCLGAGRRSSSFFDPHKFPPINLYCFFVYRAVFLALEKTESLLIADSRPVGNFLKRIWDEGKLLESLSLDLKNFPLPGLLGRGVWFGCLFNDVKLFIIKIIYFLTPHSATSFIWVSGGFSGGKCLSII